MVPRRLMGPRLVLGRVLEGDDDSVLVDNGLERIHKLLRGCGVGDVAPDGIAHRRLACDRNLRVQHRKSQHRGWKVLSAVGNQGNSAESRTLYAYDEMGGGLSHLLRKATNDRRHVVTELLVLPSRVLGKLPAKDFSSSPFDQL